MRTNTGILTYTDLSRTRKVRQGSDLAPFLEEMDVIRSEEMLRVLTGYFEAGSGSNSRFFMDYRYRDFALAGGVRRMMPVYGARGSTAGITRDTSFVELLLGKESDLNGNGFNENIFGIDYLNGEDTVTMSDQALEKEIGKPGIVRPARISPVHLEKVCRTLVRLWEAHEKDPSTRFIIVTGRASERSVEILRELFLLIPDRLRMLLGFESNARTEDLDVIQAAGLPICVLTAEPGFSLARRWAFPVVVCEWDRMASFPCNEDRLALVRALAESMSEEMLIEMSRIERNVIFQKGADSSSFKYYGTILRKLFPDLLSARSASRAPRPAAAGNKAAPAGNANPSASRGNNGQNLPGGAQPTPAARSVSQSSGPAAGKRPAESAGSYRGYVDVASSAPTGRPARTGTMNQSTDLGQQGSPSRGAAPSASTEQPPQPARSTFAEQAPEPAPSASTEQPPQPARSTFAEQAPEPAPPAPAEEAPESAPSAPAEEASRPAPSAPAEEASRPAPSAPAEEAPDPAPSAPAEETSQPASSVSEENTERRRDYAVGAVIQESETIVRLRHEKKELEETNKKLEKDNHELSTQLRTMSTEVQKLTANIHALELDKDTMGRSRNSAEKEIRDLTDQCRKLKGQNDQLTKANIAQAEKLRKARRGKDVDEAGGDGSQETPKARPTYEHLERRVRQLYRKNKSLRKRCRALIIATVIFFVLMIWAFVTNILGRGKTTENADISASTSTGADQSGADSSAEAAQAGDETSAEAAQAGAETSTVAGQAGAEESAAPEAGQTESAEAALSGNEASNTEAGPAALENENPKDDWSVIQGDNPGVALIWPETTERLGQPVGFETYYHIRFAQDETGSGLSEDGTLPYIGVYVNNKPNDTDEVKYYQWKEVSSLDPSMGILADWIDVPGIDYYLHIAYAADQNGTDFSTTDPTGRPCVGYYISGHADGGVSPDSGSYSDYTWAYR